MTQPTTIYFGMDESEKFDDPAPKIYLRTLLFATAKRGRVIEGMYVELSRNQSKKLFPVWVLGDEKLVRGSGLFIGENGIATNHYYLTLRDETNFRFASGDYDLNVFAKLLNVRIPKLLLTQRLQISPQHATDIQNQHAGVYFDWLPIESRYVAHSEARRPGLESDEAAKLLSIMTTGLSQKV